MRILFSAIGGSDPIKRMLDGPMLHCCRVYKPDRVYLYFSQKMLEYENKDQRYTWAIERLGEKLGHKFETVKIERSKLAEVQLFDTFYNDFEGILSEIEEQYPDAEIYVNASSGTPAMKSAYVVIAAMSNRKINAVQVSSGHNAPVHDRDSDEGYDKELQWELNQDNEPNFTDRTTIIDSPRFLVKIKKENVRRLVAAYDYSAARIMVEEIEEYLHPDAVKLINAAEARAKLDYVGVVKALKGTDISIIPVKDDKKRDITEYLLRLGIMLKQHDYLGFIRGITPAASELMRTAFQTAVGNDIENYCAKVNGHFILSEEILRQTDKGLEILNILDNEFVKRGGFREIEWSTAQLEPVISEMSDDEKIKKYANVIRKAEYTLRNPAAHTIISVGDDLIQRQIDMSGADLYDVIKKMAVRIGLVPKTVWNSYDEMNELILNKLDI
ncbi:MAG: hypothetical protein LUF26_05755 [Firmicutes bacterium]|nr:hypothetical protein [Bacillota bacterium]